MFVCGQKILCIDGSFHPSIVEFADQVPREGAVYTVRALSSATNIITRKAELCVHLFEINTPLNAAGKEVYFSTWRFIPLGHLAAEKHESKTETVSVISVVRR